MRLSELGQHRMNRPSFEGEKIIVAPVLRRGGFFEGIMSETDYEKYRGKCKEMVRGAGCVRPYADACPRVLSLPVLGRASPLVDEGGGRDDP